MGTLVVWRGSGDIAAVVAGDEQFEPFQARGAWSVSYLDAELVGEDARPLLTGICRQTQAPALTAFVFEGDCAFVSAIETSGAFWSTCLVRDVVADLDGIDDAEMLRRYGSPEHSAAHGAAWSRAAGLNPDPAALREVFAFGDSDDIFLGLRLFDGLLTGLGLPASETASLHENA